MVFIELAWNYLITYITSIEDLIKYILIAIALIDFYHLISKYYASQWYVKSLESLDAIRLKYLRRIVISGYKTLSSQRIIDKAIKKVRDLESRAEVEQEDFSEYEETYKTQLKDVSHRKYL